MRQVYYKLVPYGSNPTAETLTKWFTEGAADVTGPADRAGYDTRFATWWCGRIEACLGSQGFAVGTTLSLADVLLYNTFAEILQESEVHDGADMPAFKREPFGDKAAVDKLLAVHPKIAACCASVAANENIQKWLATRGKQAF